MSGALQIGPLALPLSLLVLMGAAVCALCVGTWLGRKAGVDVDAMLWWSFAVGLLVSRLAYVWEFRSAYLASPLDIIDIRDGGWNPTAGLIGAWAFALSRQARQAALQKPLRWALATGSVLWVAGSIALSIQSGAPRRLPPLALATLEGAPVALDGFAGKPTVVNLWATWCGPCIREMPVLHEAQRDRPEVNFVFINQGEPQARVSTWLSSRGLPLRNVLIDGKGEAGSAFDQRALPTTLFFDAKGQWVATRIGELSRATLAEKLQAASR